MKILKKSFLIVLLVLSLLSIPGCLSAPLQGGLFTFTNQHVYGTHGSQIGSAQVDKKGESCSWSILFIRDIFYGTGRNVSEAMTEGGITKIAVVDRKSLSILGPLFYMECMEVYGE